MKVCVYIYFSKGKGILSCFLSSQAILYTYTYACVYVCVLNRKAELCQAKLSHTIKRKYREKRVTTELALVLAGRQLFICYLLFRIDTGKGEETLGMCCVECERLSQRKMGKFFSVLLHIINGILLWCPQREFSNYMVFQSCFIRIDFYLHAAPRQQGTIGVAWLYSSYTGMIDFPKSH